MESIQIVRDLIRPVVQARALSRSVSMNYLGHATILIEIDGLRILTDPLLRMRTLHLRRPTIAEPRLYVENIDAIVISHMHWDHLDLPSLRMLPPTTPTFAPKGSGKLLQRAGLLDIREVNPGDEWKVGGITIETTVANHDGFRPPFGPHGECVGFMFHGSRSIYFAGDTDLFPEMSDIGQRTDVAFLPVWGWGPTLGNGHLNPIRAAEALRQLLPSIAVPIHWGTLCPIGMKWARPRFLTEPPREFVAHAANLAPDVIVRIVQPGSRLDLNYRPA